MHKAAIVALSTLALALCASTASSQTIPPDTMKVDYFSNANTNKAPDGTLRIINPGTAPGNVCASIYVFDPDQELSECCSCFVSPDGLATLSVNTDLTKNPLTPVTLTTGLIKIVSTIPVSGVCPTYPVTVSPEAAIRAWTTHIQTSAFSETETSSQDATLTLTEMKRMERACSAIQIDGSGHGLCTCGSGGQNGE
jgi:hypothetical protein